MSTESVKGILVLVFKEDSEGKNLIFKLNESEKGGLIFMSIAETEDKGHYSESVERDSKKLQVLTTVWKVEDGHSEKSIVQVEEQVVSNL